uniref:Uncharacterized protein n=1 Tax=Rhizophora mucronata TaxID=61149 RepID=A0A2P2PY92_RHIMU
MHCMVETSSHCYCHDLKPSSSQCIVRNPY